jgi:hypothetical protein
MESNYQKMKSGQLWDEVVPPEWKVNLLALGKEPWIFKDLEDQLNMYCQQ